MRLTTSAGISRIIRRSAARAVGNFYFRIL
jgi:hypothetical protein